MKVSIKLILLTAILLLWFYAVFSELKEGYYFCDTDYSCEVVHGPRDGA